MKKEFIFAGFGGQGTLLIGKFLALACMKDGKHVSWLPSYGPEMRGGTANCSVIISDEPIASPLVDEPDVVIAMNEPSLDKFEPHVKPGGLLIINSSLIDRQSVRDDIEVVYCDSNHIAEAVNNPKGANVAILGAMLEKCPVVMPRRQHGDHAGFHSGRARPAQGQILRGQQKSSPRRHGNRQGALEGSLIRNYLLYNSFP